MVLDAIVATRSINGLRSTRDKAVGQVGGITRARSARDWESRLVEAFTVARNRSVKLKLLNPTERTRHLLEITGLARIVET